MRWLSRAPGCPTRPRVLGGVPTSAPHPPSPWASPLGARPAPWKRRGEQKQWARPAPGLRPGAPERPAPPAGAVGGAADVQGALLAVLSALGGALPPLPSWPRSSTHGVYRFSRGGSPGGGGGARAGYGGEGPGRGGALGPCVRGCGACLPTGPSVRACRLAPLVRVWCPGGRGTEPRTGRSGPTVGARPCLTAPPAPPAAETVRGRSPSRRSPPRRGPPGRRSPPPRRPSGREASPPRLPEYPPPAGRPDGTPARAGDGGRRQRSHWEDAAQRGGQGGKGGDAGRQGPGHAFPPPPPPVPFRPPPPPGSSWWLPRLV